MHARFAFGLPLFCVAFSLAQQPSATPSSDQTYTLNQTVRAVILDITVTDRNGKPVPNLTATDFTVKEDGVPQHLDLFEAPDAHLLPPASVNDVGDRLLRNAGSAPLTLLLLDEISTEPEDLAYSRQQAANYLQRQPAHLATPTTLLALTGSRLKILCNYTTDRDQVLAAVKADHEPPSWYALRDRVPGFKTTGLITAYERLKVNLDTLNEIAIANQAYRGRKNLLWIGPGLPALNSVQAVDRNARDVVNEAIRRTSTAMLQARLTVSTVDPQGISVGTTELVVPSAAGTIITNSGDPAEGELSFEQLALETGGRIYRLRNDVAAEINEGVQYGSAYYTVAYNPSNRNYDGKYRRIHVELKDRPNLVARTRDGYDAVLVPDSLAAKPQTALALALTSSLRYQAIAISAHLSPAAQPETLHVLVDTGDLHWDPDSSGQKRISNVLIVTANVGKDGKIINYKQLLMHATQAQTQAPGQILAETPAQTQTPAQTPTPAQTATAPPSGAAPVTSPPRPRAEFDLPATTTPAAISFRVLVRDEATGHLGSVDLPLR